MARKPDRQEERWARTMNPGTLVDLVEGRGVTSKRKFRLVAAACCRQAWPMLKTEERLALEVIERYADGRAKYNEMRLAVQDMRIPGYRSQPLLVEAARRDNAFSLLEVIGRLLGVLWGGAPDDLEEKHEGYGHGGGYWKKEDEWQSACAMFCHLLRDSFADVFQPVSIAPAWRTPAVLGLAEGAYEHRELPAGALEPVRLAVLADALEEAGCGDKVVLEHLRGPGPHVRGCWLVDLVLAKV
jgi:hypothetical protein